MVRLAVFTSVAEILRVENGGRIHSYDEGRQPFVSGALTTRFNHSHRNRGKDICSQQCRTSDAGPSGEGGGVCIRIQGLT
jgi:hypothetical protein